MLLLPVFASLLRFYLYALFVWLDEHLPRAVHGIGASVAATVTVQNSDKVR